MARAYPGIFLSRNDGHALRAAGSPSFEAKSKELSKSGFRLHIISVSVDNDVPQFVGMHRPRSGGHPPWAAGSTAKEHRRTMFRPTIAAVAAIVASTLLLTGCGQSSSQSGNDDSARDEDTSYVQPTEPDFSEPEVPWPSNGSGSVGNGGGGCLSISVPSGNEAYNVKLKQGTSPVWDVFMTPGSSTEFAVPLGTYDLTYGAGEEWYGWDYAFGPQGAYSETSETFTFESGSCWEVELILQVGGNLDSNGIPYDDF